MLNRHFNALLTRRVLISNELQGEDVNFFYTMVWLKTVILFAIHFGAAKQTLKESECNFLLLIYKGTLIQVF